MVHGKLSPHEMHQQMTEVKDGKKDPQDYIHLAIQAILERYRQKGHGHGNQPKEGKKDDQP